jgi:hypothetical protein
LTLPETTWHNGCEEPMRDVLAPLFNRSRGVALAAANAQPDV